MNHEDTPLLEEVKPSARDRCDVLISAGQADIAASRAAIHLFEINSELEIGRGPSGGAAPKIETSDPHMSRRHARARRGKGQDITLCDLGSRNGTFVDDVRVQGECPLRNGAVIFVGSHVFVYRMMSREAFALVRAGLARPFGPVATFSPAMACLHAKLRKLAASNLEILLSGETGVGKEVLAEAIHRESGRKGPFVAINCAALPEGLVESELFGYARGAHSTANTGKPGLIESAQGGTLYLDEIGEMSSTAQAKLLRFLQDGHYTALGTTHTKRLDVHIIAATRAGLADLERGDGLRSDLAARLGPEPILVPPLRERIEDVGLLVDYFLGGQACPFDLHGYRSLFVSSWPGNVRGLERTVRTVMVLGASPEASTPEKATVQSPAEQPDTTKETREFSPARASRPSLPELSALLQRHRGNVGLVAREIGRQRTLVWRWLRNAGLAPEEYRDTLGPDTQA